MGVPVDVPLAEKGEPSVYRCAVPLILLLLLLTGCGKESFSVKYRTLQTTSSFNQVANTLAKCFTLTTTTFRQTQ